MTVGSYSLGDTNPEWHDSPVIVNIVRTVASVPSDTEHSTDGQATQCAT